MAIICNKYQSTRDFSYKNSKFVAEASDLGMGAHDARVYDDACDVGFVMVSHITGDSLLFVQDGVDMNGDDIAGWWYKAAYISTTRGWIPLRSKQLGELRTLIIND